MYRRHGQSYVCGVFGLIMQRNGQKRDKKNRRENTSVKSPPPRHFRPKAIDIDFPQEVFSGVFELPLLRNAQKCHPAQRRDALQCKLEGLFEAV
jgi:hypothetical protein